MIEIYKTNVQKRQQAKQIVKQIKTLFSNYRVNFDLEDCDCILRIDTGVKILDNNTIIKIVRENGFKIETLSDEISLVKPKFTVNI
ncbi:hypothetical protein [Aquimarina muelleri]|nr:hypothetical protein [Aquimarina muelleri]MCX2763842.1 hypothetical protein [Aquimarina muelleri]